MAKKLISDIERFWQSVIKRENGCIEWQKAKDKDGYGLFTIGSATDNSKKMVRAHRWIYEEVVGPISVGLVIDHICQNKSCANTNHMQVVTPLRNSQLAAERGNYNFPRLPHTEATKEKIRRKHLGMKASAETRKAMSLGKIGNKNCLGYKQTEQHKKNIGLGLIGNKNSVGRKASAETRAKMSLAQKKRQDRRRGILG